MESLGSEKPLIIRREQLPLLTRPYVEPRTPTERILAQIWREALSVDRIGMDDRYFDLGGDSLVAANIFSQIEAKLGIYLPMTVLDNAPTIAQLAPQVDALLAERT